MFRDSLYHKVGGGRGKDQSKGFFETDKENKSDDRKQKR